MRKYVLTALGWIVLACTLLLGSTVLLHSQVSSLSGLAVAQSSTRWSNVRDAAVGDNLTSGLLSAALMMFDTTNGDFDRLRGTIANGILVDVTRMPGGVFTPADGTANPSGILGSESFVMVWSDAVWDRLRAPVSDGTSAGGGLSALGI